MRSTIFSRKYNKLKKNEVTELDFKTTIPDS